MRNMRCFELNNKALYLDYMAGLLFLAVSQSKTANNDEGKIEILQQGQIKARVM